MNWSLYLYLGPLALLALLLVALYARAYGALSACHERRTAAEVGLLAATLVLGILVVYGNFLRGTSYFAYRDVGSDTFDQYVPYYLDLVRKVGSGSLGTWNMNYGLGASFMSYQSWTLDPFCLVMVPLTLLLGEKHLSLVLVLVQALKVLLCGLLFDHVLTFYCERPLSRMLGSVLYAFCGYLMLWGQHYWTGAAIVMATVLMLALELMMRRWSVPRFLGLAAATAVSILMSTYSGLAVMLYATAYALLRVPLATECHGVRDYLRQFCRLALPVVCGVLVSCATLVPYAIAMLTESSRVVSSGQAPLGQRALGYATGFVPLRWLPYLLSRFLGNGLVSVGANIPEDLVPATAQFAQANVYELVQMGFSVGAPVLIGQFLAWELRHASRREKVLVAVALVLCVLYCVNYFLPALANVFSTVRYRSCFALAGPACIAMALGWERCFMERDISVPVLVASLVLALAIVVWSLFNTVDGRLVCVCYLFALVLVAALSLVLARSEGPRPVVAVLLVAAVASTSVVDGFFVSNSRLWCTREDFPCASAAYDKDSNEALAYVASQGGEGSFRVDKVYGDLNAALSEGFMGVDSYNSTINSNLEDFYDKLWPRAIRSLSAYQATRDDNNHSTLLRMLGVRYVMAADERSIDGYQKVATFGPVRLYKSTEDATLATVYASTTTESEVESLSPEERERLLATTAIVSNGAAKRYRTLSSSDRATAADARVTSQTGVSCTVNTDADSVCMVAVPYARGWRATVDGQEVPTFRTNYGFVGVGLKAGTHQVRLSYHPLGVTAGLALSAVGIVLAAASCVVTRRHAR